MRKARALALPALLLCAACHGQPAGPGLEHPLEGAFTWLRSSGGLAGQEITPELTGYQVRFEYEGMRLRTWRDGQLIDDTRFSIREDRQREGPLPVYVVTYDEPLRVFTFSQVEQHTLEWAGKVILVLDEGCCDRYAHTITRPDVR